MVLISPLIIANPESATPFKVNSLLVLRISFPAGHPLSGSEGQRVPLGSSGAFVFRAGQFSSIVLRVSFISNVRFLFLFLQ